MINFDEEIKKFHPSLEVDEAEDAIYNNNVTDLTDILVEMMKEAKEHEEEDNKRKEEVDVKNDVEQTLFATDKTLKDVKGKVSDDEIKKAQDARDALKKAQDSGDLEDMKKKRDDLNKIVQDLSVKLYQQAQQAQQQAGGDNGATGTGSIDGKKSDDNTVDGDFSEVDPDKDKK